MEDEEYQQEEALEDENLGSDFFSGAIAGAKNGLNSINNGFKNISSMGAKPPLIPDSKQQNPNAEPDSGSDKEKKDGTDLLNPDKKDGEVLNPDKKDGQLMNNNSNGELLNKDNEDSDLFGGKDNEKSDSSSDKSDSNDSKDDKDGKDKKDEKKKKKKKDAGKAADDATDTKKKSKFILFIKKNPWILIVIGVLVLLLIVILLLVGTAGGAGVITENLLVNNANCIIERPIKNFEVSSIYSWQTRTDEEDTTEVYPNKGIDLKTERGTEVVSAYDGEIIEIVMNENSESYNLITKYEVNDKFTYKFVYNNLCATNDGNCIESEDQISFQVGNYVSSGSFIGYTNTSDFHFEMYKNDILISPNNLFGYENPSSNCDPLKVTEITAEEVESNECGIAKVYSGDFEGYCNSLSEKDSYGSKEAFINVLETEHDNWQNSSQDEKIALIKKYCISAGSGSSCQWCSSFVIWSLKESGMFEEIGFNEPNAFAASLSDVAGTNAVYIEDVTDYVPSPGDLIFFDWQGDGVGIDHVAVVIFSNGENIRYLGGNQGNGEYVYERKISKSGAISRTSAIISGYLSW